MKMLFLGDVVGRSGRDAVIKHLPRLKKEHGVDVAVVNADNASGGFGCTPQTYQELLKAGADVITSGDHVWDQKDIIPLLTQEKRLLRPHNFPSTVPGRGVGVYMAENGKPFVIIHLLGQVFHKEHAHCPFATADAILKEHKLGGNAAAILVDFHAEATSEKTAMGQYLDGRVSAVVGSHTHIPTADSRVLKGGTAYQTDTGMCGDYDSVIGFAPEGPLQRFLTKMPKVKLEVASGEGTVSAALIETDDKTGRAISIQHLLVGGVMGKRDK